LGQDVTGVVVVVRQRGGGGAGDGGSAVVGVVVIFYIFFKKMFVECYRTHTTDLCHGPDIWITAKSLFVD
jgi:hypothetical protein